MAGAAVALGHEFFACAYRSGACFTGFQRQAFGIERIGQQCLADEHGSKMGGLVGFQRQCAFHSQGTQVEIVFLRGLLRLLPGAVGSDAGRVGYGGHAGA